MANEHEHGLKLNEFPTEIIVLITKKLTSPGVFALTCARFYDIIKGHDIDIKSDAKEIFLSKSLGSVEIYNRITSLRKYVSADYAKTVLQCAARINNHRFVGAFRIFGYEEFLSKKHRENYITKGALMGANIYLILNPPKKEQLSNQYVNDIIKYGHIKSIQYMMHIKPQIINKHLMSVAAKYGHLHILNWARDMHRCPWNEYTPSNAAEYGHLDVLKWAILCGCPFNSYVSSKAIDNKHFNIIKYLVDNNLFAINVQTLARVIKTNDLDFIKQVADIKKELFKPSTHMMYENNIPDEEIIEYLKSFDIKIICRYYG